MIGVTDPATQKPPQRATIRMVAERAGVSTATVSYVLRGANVPISEATAARVRRAAETLGYRANSAAQAMRTGSNGLLLLSLQVIGDPWALAVQESISRVASANGLTALIQADGDWYETARRVQPDLLYIDNPEDDDAPRLTEMARAGQRIVAMSDTLEPRGFDVVRSLAGPGAALVMEHVTTLTGDVAYLGRGEATRQGDRRRAYLDAVDAGRVSARRLLDYDGSRTDAFRTAQRCLTRPDRPRAIVCNTDYAALAAIQAAQSLGLRVPQDVYVAGLGNTPAGASSSPSLTTAGPRDFFEAQAKLLVRAATGAGTPGTMHDFTWQLFVRESTRPTR
ncbi:LacI family transcriptional regulator [Propioniciclava coleopterorum]|uniref:LacI family transcriptional regulator n=1 Tax=Propioniciclava coleopterorum TaxID=2714937 RepID=A0A6G7Y6M2_9ACTN|nr:LacI family transcriptional regulator [Propioniciclava coleopterorum]